MEWSDEQPAKAPEHKISKLEGSVSSCKPVQPLKASGLIVRTELGSVIDFRPVQS